MAQTNNYNYYEMLELDATAAQHEVTTAFDRAKATYSGDNPAIYTVFSEVEARELLRMIEEAYAVLGNKTLRALYDQRLFGSHATGDELSYEALLAASRMQNLENHIEEAAIPAVNQQKLNELLETTQDWSGEKLREVRELKCLTLEKVHQITKINSFYVNAIEEMNPNNLPARVFIRGYVVQIAKTLGLDTQGVVNSYLSLLRDRAPLARKA